MHCAERKIYPVVSIDDKQMYIKMHAFYSESNMRHLEQIMSDVKDGKAHFAEHELIEVE